VIYQAAIHRARRRRSATESPLHGQVPIYTSARLVVVSERVVHVAGAEVAHPLGD
jgi:hypothetical protein